jgi:hypothetical protein
MGRMVALISEFSMASQVVLSYSHKATVKQLQLLQHSSHRV